MTNDEMQARLLSACAQAARQNLISEGATPAQADAAIAAMTPEQWQAVWANAVEENRKAEFYREQGRQETLSESQPKQIELEKKNEALTDENEDLRHRLDKLFKAQQTGGRT
jgi:hypothetical protein